MAICARTMLLFDPAPERLSISLASYAFTLQPNEVHDQSSSR